jgi:hypothetical protein
MRYLALAAVAAAILVTCTGQARATLLPPPSTNQDQDTVVFSVETTVTDEADPDAGTISVDPETGVVYSHGCRQVDVAAIAKSFLFHSVIYRFHQIKHWCWHNGIVYDERHAWTFEGSSTACFNTAYPDNSWFFSWHGKAQGGHFSEVRAWVTNCVFKVGAWNQLYPDVKIWAHADGSWDKAVQNG